MSEVDDREPTDPIDIMPAHLPIDRAKLAEVCRRHQVRRLALYGSVLRDDFRPESDVDVLIEFSPQARVGFFKLFEIERDLSTVFGGHPVETVHPENLNRWIRDRVLAEAEVQYED